MPRTAPVLVGIVGYAQVGKDTAGAAFERCGYQRVGFADRLKALAYALNPLIEVSKGLPVRYADIVDTMGMEEAKRRFPGSRQFLKDLGGGCRHHLAEDIWVRIALENVLPLTVVTDVRFLNEAIAIRAAAVDMNGRAAIVRVTRPGYGPESDFEKEVALIPHDVEMVNAGTIADLNTTVRNYLCEWMEW